MLVRAHVHGIRGHDGPLLQLVTVEREARALGQARGVPNRAPMASPRQRKDFD